MKKIFLSLLMALVIVACKQQDKKTDAADLVKEENTTAPASDSTNLTTIQWIDSTYRDMGKMKKGEVMEISFRFKNTGDKPLVVADVTAGCGCTIPEKPTEPYGPGKEGVIKAKFDSNNQQQGEHRKNVTVTANTSPASIHNLTFRVDINK